MFRIALAALTVVMMTTSFTPALKAQEPPLTRSDVETIVREYLLANPELLEEVFSELQNRRQAEADAARQEQLAAYRDALENSPLDPVFGNPEGDVTLVEFFDYNCGYCKRAHEDLERLLAADPNLRVVLKEFPVLGRPSMEAAAVSIAVNQVAPDRYKTFHDALLTREGRADEASALAVVDSLGLPREEIEAAMDSAAVRETVEQSYEIAQALGLSGTPSYVVGDIVEFGAVGFDQLLESINLTRCGAIAC
jgi:protein-disulfide isomerase